MYIAQHDECCFVICGADKIRVFIFSFSLMCGDKTLRLVSCLPAAGRPIALSCWASGRRCAGWSSRSKWLFSWSGAFFPEPYCWIFLRYYSSIFLSVTLTVIYISDIKCEGPHKWSKHQLVTLFFIFYNFSYIQCCINDYENYIFWPQNQYNNICYPVTLNLWESLTSKLILCNLITFLWLVEPTNSSQRNTAFEDSYKKKLGLE